MGCARRGSWIVLGGALLVLQAFSIQTDGPGLPPCTTILRGKGFPSAAGDTTGGKKPQVLGGICSLNLIGKMSPIES